MVPRYTYMNPLQDWTLLRLDLSSASERFQRLLLIIDRIGSSQTDVLHLDVFLFTVYKNLFSS